MSMINLCSVVEHQKSFITSWPGVPRIDRASGELCHKVKILERNPSKLIIKPYRANRKCYRHIL